MLRYVHRVYRVKVEWDGGDYYLSAMVNKEWMNAAHLGDNGWEFIAFVPNPETSIGESVEDSELKFVRMAVFKRQMTEGEDMQENVIRARQRKKK